MWRKSVRWLTAFLAVGISVILMIAFTLFLVVDTKKIGNLLEQTIAAQTGGNLQIASIKFNAFTGFAVKGIRFDPPNADGTRHMGESPEFLEIREFKFAYNIWSILYGTLAITEANFDGGKFVLHQKKGSSAFDGIAAFREKTFPPVAANPNEPKPPKPIGQRLRELSKSFFIPIRIKINSIGVKDLDIDVVQQSTTGEKKALYVKGLGTLLNISAMGRNAKLNFQANARSVNGYGVALGEMSTSIGLDISSNPDSGGFEIKDLKIKLLDSLNSVSSLSIYSNANTQNKLQYDFSNETDISLKIPVALKQIFPSDLITAGEMSLKINPTRGELSFEELQKQIESQQYVALAPESSEVNLAMTGVLIKWPSKGLTLKSLNLNYAIKEKRANGETLEISTKLNQTAESIRIDNQSPEDPLSSFLNGLDISMDSALHYPNPISSRINLKLKIAEAGLDGPSIETIKLPIAVDLRADATNSLSTAAAHIQMKLGDLLSNQVIATCENRCRKFRAEYDLAIPSLALIWDTVKQNAARRIPPKFNPDKFIGEISSHGAIAGSLPERNFKDVLDLISAAKWDSEITAELANFSASIPFNKTAINNAQYMAKLSGNERRQAMNIRHEFETFKMDLGTKRKTPEEVLVTEFNWQTTVVALIPKLNRGIDLARNLRTQFDTKIQIKEVASKNILNRPLQNIEILTKASTHRQNKINLDSFSLRIANMATNAQLTGNVSLDERLYPENFAIKLKTAVDEIPRELLKGIDISGKLGLEINLLSDDLEEAQISGTIEIDGLCATLNGKDQSTPPVVEIKNLTGTIPIFHKFNISQLRNHAGTIEEPKQNPTSDSNNPVRYDSVIEITDDDLSSATFTYLTKIRPPIVGDTRIAINQDYGNFRDFYPKRRPLTLAYLKIADLQAENIEIDAEISQNQISINNVIATFIGGKIQGDLKFTFSNQPISIKTAFHVTRLNTEKLVQNIPGLKKKARGVLGGSNPYLDGAVHIAYDMRTGDLQGGLNITSIGKDQLRMILYYIDPNDSDSTISAIKAALNFGEVKMVSVPIKNGEIGLDVSLRILTAPLPTPTLQGFPIAKLISNFKDQELVVDEKAH